MLETAQGKQIWGEARNARIARMQHEFVEVMRQGLRRQKPAHAEGKVTNLWQG